MVASCKKQEDEAYEKTVTYQAFCDSCRVDYLAHPYTESHALVIGDFECSFIIHNSKHLYIAALDFDTIGTTTVRILVGGILSRSASNTDALDTVVMASGHP